MPWSTIVSENNYLRDFIGNQEERKSGRPTTPWLNNITDWKKMTPDRLLWTTNTTEWRRIATQPGHCLHHLLPQLTVLISFVRGNIHICFPLFNIRSLKTLISVFVYLNMYNPPIVILCFFQFTVLPILPCFISSYWAFHSYSIL